MNIEIFQKNFQVRELDIKPYLIVVSIFITIILVIVLLNNKIEDYYICNGKVNNKNLIIRINKEDLKVITENKELYIERNIFTYKVTKIDEVINDGFLYYDLVLEFERIPDHLFIDNNIIEIKVITNKTTIFDYLIKTVKGE